MSATASGHILQACCTVQNLPISQRYSVCSCCGAYQLNCLAEAHCGPSIVVFADGACSFNGRDGAISGIGVIMGMAPDHVWGVPITELMDGSAPRTSQRAELLAAIYAVITIKDHIADGKQQKLRRGYPPVFGGVAVVATDSQYVVDGMTRWIHTWRNNGWKAVGTNRPPENLDLFLDLQDEILLIEQDCRFGFWKIPREENKEADRLAKMAAQL